MAKIIHLLNQNQKIKLDLVLKALENLRYDYSKGNNKTDELIEINRIIKEIHEHDVPNHILN